MAKSMENRIAQLDDICLIYLESVKDTEGVGAPAFKVRKKIFAMQHPMDGRPSLWCKAPEGAQQILVASDPETFFVPPYVGQHGWIGVYLDVELDWDFIAQLIEDSYCMTAPKKLVALLNQAQG
jgi:predicted DNA-binding protein (MmcQ/YjbR family)